MTPNALRLALRTMTHQRLATALITGSFAVALGLGATIFGLIDGLGGRPLNIESPQSLLRIFTSVQQDPQGYNSYPDVQDVVARSHTLRDIAAYGTVGAAVSGGDLPAEVNLLNVVSTNYFEVVGVVPHLGRRFAAGDDRDAVVVVSSKFWQRRLRGRTDATGETVWLNRAPFTVIGVLPTSFSGTDAQVAPDLWIPIGAYQHIAEPRLEARERRWLTMLARARDDLSLIDVQRDLDAISEQLSERWPASNAGRRIVAVADSTARRSRVAPVAIALFLVAALTLFVALANVSVLQTGRLFHRRSDFAIRLALGARPGDIIRQLLLEGLVLSVIATAGAIAVASVSIRLLPQLLPPTPVALGFEFRLDNRVLLATVVAGLMGPVFLALLPAVNLLRPENALHNARSAATYVPGSLRRLLIGVQVALAISVLVVAALLVRGVIAARDSQTGLGRGPVLLMTIAPGSAGYDATATHSLIETLRVRLASVAAVERLAVADRVPLSPFGGAASEEIRKPGEPGEVPATRVKHSSVAAGYFGVMGTVMKTGRECGATDRLGTPPVVIVNEQLQKTLWPAGDALDAIVHVGPELREHRVIGVVETGKYNRLDEPPQPYVFFCFDQRGPSEATFVIRARADPGSAARAVREELYRLHPELPALQMVTLVQHLQLAAYDLRVAAALAVVLGIVALTLISAGLYGIVSATVGARAKEIGLRIALGGRPVDIQRDLLRQTGLVVLAGSVCGLLTAAALAKALSSIVFASSVFDPVAYVIAVLIVGSSAVVATVIPARRASRIDPLVALKVE